MLPLAHSDPLILNVVLALGGSIISSSPSTRQEEEQALQCYGKAINEPNLRLTNWVQRSADDSDCIRLFLTIILLCHLEVSDNVSLQVFGPWMHVYGWSLRRT